MTLISFRSNTLIIWHLLHVNSVIRCFKHSWKYQPNKWNGTLFLTRVCFISWIVDTVTYFERSFRHVDNIQDYQQSVTANRMPFHLVGYSTNKTRLPILWLRESSSISPTVQKAKITSFDYQHLSIFLQSLLIQAKYSSVCGTVLLKLTE